MLHKRFDPGRHPRQVCWVGLKYFGGGEVVVSLDSGGELILPLLRGVVHCQDPHPRITHQPVPKSPLPRVRCRAMSAVGRFALREIGGDVVHRTKVWLLRLMEVLIGAEGAVQSVRSVTKSNVFRSCVRKVTFCVKHRRFVMSMTSSSLNSLHNTNGRSIVDILPFLTDS